jgi:hypothetical protein
VKPDDRSVRGLRAVAAGRDLGAVDCDREVLDMIDGGARSDLLDQVR